MSARLIDGKALASVLQAEIAQKVAEQLSAGGPRPGLAAIQVGTREDSTRYVRGKIRACEKVGIASHHFPLPESTSQAELLDLIERLNGDPAIHGILVQLPLPRHIDESVIIRAVAPHKDVDGFHPENLGLLAAGTPRFVACTPLGVQQLLLRYDVPIAGSNVVILGRSTIVGKPLALLLMRKGVGGDATVTVAHSRSRDLRGLTRTADILVAAMGQPGYITAEMVKPGAVVIDVGTTPTPDGRLAGDVDFDGVRDVAGAISPVPGGVGPMTITMLLHNTYLASRPPQGA